MRDDLIKAQMVRIILKMKNGHTKRQAANELNIDIDVVNEWYARGFSEESGLYHEFYNKVKSIEWSEFQIYTDEKTCPVCGKTFDAQQFNHCPYCKDSRVMKEEVIGYCENCGAEVTDYESDYCRNCGQIIGDEVIKESESSIFSGFSRIFHKKEKKNIKKSPYVRYENILKNLKDKYELKENEVKDLLAKRFEPPQQTYDVYISLIEYTTSNFNEQIYSIEELISLSDEYSFEIERKIKYGIVILNDIIEKVDYLKRKLIMQISDDIANDKEIDILMEELDRHIRNIENYQ